MSDGRDDGTNGEVSELEESGPPARRRGRLAIALSAAVCVALLVGVAIVAAQGGDGNGGDGTDGLGDKKIVHSPEADTVIAAVGATTAAGSYTATYELHSTPATVSTPPTSSCTPETTTVNPDGSMSSGRACSINAMGSGTGQPVTITGRATINTDPYRMMAESQVTGLGAITVRVDGTRLWETGGGNYGLDGRGIGAGQSLSGFANLVAGTLGDGPGALTMLTLASPNGYLNLQKEAVSSVTPAGTGMVDGAPVTYYEVDIDPARLLDIPGLTSEQTKTIHAALAQLARSGYQSRKTKVGIDASGLIRETTTVTAFADGSTQSTHSVFSNFGCAGIVVLPGDPDDVATEPTPCAPTVPTSPPLPATTVPPTTDTTTAAPESSATTIVGGSATTTTRPAAADESTGQLTR